MLRKIRERIEELRARVNQLENLRGPMGDNEAGVVCGTAGQIKEELAFLESLVQEIEAINRGFEICPPDPGRETTIATWLRGGE